MNSILHILYFQMVSNWMSRLWAAKCLDASMITVQTHTEWWLNYGQKLVSFRIISSLLKLIQQLVFPKFVDFVERTYLSSQKQYISSEGVNSFRSRYHYVLKLKDSFIQTVEYILRMRQRNINKNLWLNSLKFWSLEK